MDTSSPRLRLGVIGVVVVACFVALFARLWYLQVLAAPELAVAAISNSTRTVSVEAPRGRILDVKGRVLVDNRTSLVVTIDRTQFRRLEDKEGMLQRLAQTLTDYGSPTKLSTLERRVADQQYDDLQAVPVANDITEAAALHLAEYSEDFPSVTIRRETVRVYPYGAIGANVLGYTGRITAERLKSAEPGVDPETGAEKVYRTDSTIGLAGVEASYEKELRGTPGIERITVDSLGRPVATESYQPPKAGSDIQLHIDIDVQARAEQALRDKLARLKGVPQSDGIMREATAGSVVAMDPQTGGVIALATYPSYDQREFVGGISQERYEQLSNIDGVSALIDRSITGQYAPGSTFKLVTAAAALTNDYIEPDTLYNDTGEYFVGNPPQTFQNPGKKQNGWLALPKSLEISSDTFYYWLGDRMDGTTRIQDVASAFGFGDYTDIDLPNESPGYVLTPEAKKALKEKYPTAYEDGQWYTGDNVQLAIGQNVVVVTPIQLATAYSALANGGSVLEPHVVWRILGSGTDDAGNPIVERVIEPVVRKRLDLPPEVIDPIIAGLSRVTSGQGTAAAAFSPFDQSDFRIVGKTGTAQVNGKADTSLFASYGPAGAPRYAVTAVMEESGSGAEASGEVVRHVYEMLAGKPLTPAGPATAGVRD